MKSGRTHTALRGGTIALLIALTSGVAVVAPAAIHLGQTPAGAAVLGNDYPSNLANAAKDSVVDPWQFYNRECTSFVAWRLNQLRQRHCVQGLLRRAAVGRNAENWGPTALVARHSGQSNPSSSAQWLGTWAGNGGAISEGHVAWVANIEANRDDRTSEYNYTNSGQYKDVRTGLNPSSFSGFIHFDDLGTTNEAMTPASTGAPANPPPSGAHGYWLVGSDGGSSASVRRPSTDRPDRSGCSARRWWASLRRLDFGVAIGWWRPTAAFSASATPAITDRFLGSGSRQADSTAPKRLNARPSSAWCRRRTGR